jgi:hypothetical protein
MFVCCSIALRFAKPVQISCYAALPIIHSPVGSVPKCVWRVPRIVNGSEQTTA